MYDIGEMDLKAEPMAGKELTGKRMYETVAANFSDLGSWLKKPFPQWFDYVKSIPYVADSDRFRDRLLEVVPRPSYCMDRKMFPRIDCKKKSILIGSWAEGNGGVR